MKNLTRVLVLALVFSMIISTVAFGATFTDVEAGTPVAEATDVLAGLGILKGYEDGTFGPDKVITRAEVVAVANRLQGLSEAAKGAAGTTIYTDVAADAWYAGDVNLATQMGIISGDGNGLFRPEDSVKYEEAVKIMVAALGYQNNYVLAKGGWPTGYLVIASEAGVTKGITAGAGQDAYRGIVARLAYNSIDAPMMVSDGYNSDGTYQYKAKEDKQLGYDKLGVYKVDAKVTATSLVTGSNLETDEVTVTATGAYDIFDSYFWTVTGGVATPNPNKKIEVGATDLADYLGYTVTIFVKENDMGNYEAVAMTVPAKKNSTVTIEDATMIVSGNMHDVTNFTTTPLVLNYEDDDNDVKEEYNLAYVTSPSNAIAYEVYVNGAKVTVDATTLASIIAGGKVELLDNNDDGLYDYVFVTQYKTDVVTDVFANNTKIALDRSIINLENAIKGKKGYAYTITLDGEAIDVADLKKDDVISYSTDANNYKYDIIVSREVVSAAVEGRTGTALTGYTYTIDGTDYEVAANCTIGTLKAGDEGDFYIDAFGQIAKFEKTKTTASNYGFVIGMGSYSSVGETAYEVKILAKDGSVATYELATKVTTNAVNDGSFDVNTAKVPAADVNAWALVNFPDGGDTDADPDFTLYTSAPASTALEITATEAQLVDYAKRMVTYKVNSDGKLSTVIFANASAANSELVYAAPTTVGKYSAKTNTVDNKFLTDETVIFNLPMTAGVTSDDFGIAGKLDADETYKMIALDVDPDTNEIGAMIIAGDGATLGQTENLAVFMKMMETADDTITVTFMQGGEVKSLVADTTELSGTANFGAMVSGSLFAYKVDGEGLMERADLILNANYTVTSGGFSMTDYDGASWTNINLNTGAAYDFGIVTDKRSGNIVALEKFAAYNKDAADGFSGANPQRLAIPEDAVVTVVDLTKKHDSAARVTAGHYADIQATKLADTDSTAGYEWEIADKDADFSVFVKYYKDEIVDVVVIKGAAYALGLQAVTAPTLY